jgi:demethoxyubiquinone hydroxylase (CLK1/Coq7/Cat5 family)
MDTNDNRTSTIDQLNSFLRGELAAVESYRLALEKLDSTIYRGTLLECARSHEQRARLLSEAIVQRGGAPVKSSGAWGAFARLVESGAAAFGERAAIAALEEGEDHGLQDYRRDLADLEDSARELTQSRLIPEQRQTHDSIRNIKRQLAA